MGLVTFQYRGFVDFPEPSSNDDGGTPQKPSSPEADLIHRRRRRSRRKSEKKENLRIVEEVLDVENLGKKEGRVEKYLCGFWWAFLGGVGVARGW